MNAAQAARLADALRRAERAAAAAGVIFTPADGVGDPECLVTQIESLAGLVESLVTTVTGPETGAAAAEDSQHGRAGKTPRRAAK